MDGSNEPRRTRASKRRRISPPAQAVGKPSRSPSPDELASDPTTPLVISRQASTPSFSHQPLSNTNDEPRRPSYSPVSDSSPDELSNSRADFHHFHRGTNGYRPSSFSERARQTSAYALDGRDGPRPPSPPTPEYSRISTPIASPPPEAVRIELKEAQFMPYSCKHVLQGHKKGVSAVRVSKDGTLLASCCELRILLGANDSFCV